MVGDADRDTVSVHVGRTVGVHCLRLSSFDIDIHETSLGLALANILSMTLSMMVVIVVIVALMIVVGMIVELMIIVGMRRR